MGGPEGTELRSHQASLRGHPYGPDKPLWATLARRVSAEMADTVSMRTAPQLGPAAPSPGPPLPGP